MKFKANIVAEEGIEVNGTTRAKGVKIGEVHLSDTGFAELKLEGGIQISGGPCKFDYNMLQEVYDPQVASDAATKGYVDGLLGGGGATEVATGASAPSPRVGELLWIDTDETAKISTPVALVSSLPVSPVDGQEIYYQSAAMATDGIIWHLRYRLLSPSIYKWEFLGGPPLVAVDDTNRPYTSSAAWQGAPGSSILQITTPLAGDWDVEATVNILSTNAPVSGTLGCGIGIGAANPSSIPMAWAYVYQIGGNYASPNASVRLTSQAAGALFRHYCLGPNATDIHPRGRTIRVTPVRVG